MVTMKQVCLSIALLLGSGACNDDSSSDPTPPPPPPNPIIVGRTTSLVLRNGYARWTIGELNLSPSDERSWGTNQLENDLTPGDIFILDGIQCDEYYDLRLRSPSGFELEIDEEIYFPCTRPVTYVTSD